MKADFRKWDNQSQNLLEGIFLLLIPRPFGLHLWIIFIASEIIYGHPEIKDTSLRIQLRDYARLKLNYLFCAHFKLLLSPSFFILLLVDRVMHDPIMSRNDTWSSRYILKDGIKWICKAKLKLLILCPFHITV